MKSMSSGNREVSDEQMTLLKEQKIDTSKFVKTLDGWRYVGEMGEMVSTLAAGMSS
jgi:hypothetical protein